MKVYRNRETVGAYQVAEPGEIVFTVSGPRWAPTGSWAVYKPGGVVVMDNEAFTATYEEQIGAPEMLVAESGGAESGPYNPGDHSVVEVLNYMAENPDEVAWIQEQESNGQNRKGIMSYS